MASLIIFSLFFFRFNLTNTEIIEPEYKMASLVKLFIMILIIKDNICTVLFQIQSPLKYNDLFLNLFLAILCLKC